MKKLNISVALFISVLSVLTIFTAQVQASDHLTGNKNTSLSQSSDRGNRKVTKHKNGKKDNRNETEHEDDGKIILTPTVSPTPTVVSQPVTNPTNTCITNTTFPLDQSQCVYDSGTSARTLSGYKVWQSFTAGKTGTLREIDMGFFTPINGVGTLEIYAGEGTVGALLQTTPVSVVCGGGNCIIPFAVSVPVTAGQQYTFQFTPGIGMPDPYGVQMEFVGTYAGGQIGIVDPTGTYYPGFDMVFSTYVI